MKETTIGGRFLKKHIEKFYNSLIAREKCDLLSALQLLKQIIQIDMSSNSEPKSFFYFSDQNSHISIHEYYNISNH